MSATTVACVLRSGGIYDARWVRALYRGVREHWPVDALDFVCLTDVPVGHPGVREVPLVTGWPGWWAKMELLAPGTFDGPVLYLDLDTLPVGPLADLAAHALDFAMLSDLWQPHLAQSGVMAWMPGETSRAAWDVFTEDPRERMHEFHGDGEFIRSVVDPVTRLQDVFPGRIAGFKIRSPRGIIPGPPEGSSLCCGHGEPRFSDPAAGWAHALWRERAV